MHTQLLTDVCVYACMCVAGMLEDGTDGLYISNAFHKAFLEVSLLCALCHLRLNKLKLPVL